MDIYQSGEMDMKGEETYTGPLQYLPSNPCLKLFYEFASDQL